MMDIAAKLEYYVTESVKNDEPIHTILNANKELLNSKNEEYKILREESLGYLDCLNEICNTHNIEYFLFSDLLKQALLYNDFAPGQVQIEVGMLRDHYEHFAQVAAEECTQKNLYFVPLGSSTSKAAFIERNATDINEDEEESTKADHESFDNQSLSPLRIVVFDAIPDDFETQKLFLKVLKIINTKHGKILSSRQSIRCVGFLGTIRRGLSYFLSSILPQRFMLRLYNYFSQRYNNKNMMDYAKIFGKQSKAAKKEMLTPTETIPFAQTLVQVPNDYSVWASNKSMQTQLKQIRVLQLASLEILHEIDRVCRLLSIKYFLCGGTLLGHVRHGGVMPWDDDIDIAMLRKDYERFLNEAGPLLSSEFFLQSRRNDPQIPYLFSKVRMNETEYITEYNERRNFHKGICVDIFPFDAIPNDPDEQLVFKQEVLQAAKRHHKAVNKQQTVENRRPKTFEQLAVTVFAKAYRSYFWHIDLSQTQSNYDAVVKKYANSSKSEYVASFVPSYTVIRTKDLLPYFETEFEGIHAYIPHKAEAFLRMQYGDFMTHPSKFKQTGHDLVDWKDRPNSTRNVETVQLPTQESNFIPESGYLPFSLDEDNLPEGLEHLSPHWVTALAINLENEKMYETTKQKLDVELLDHFLTILGDSHIKYRLTTYSEESQQRLTLISKKKVIDIRKEDIAPVLEMLENLLPHCSIESIDKHTYFDIFNNKKIIALYKVLDNNEKIVFIKGFPIYGTGKSPLVAKGEVFIRVVRS